MMNYPKWVQRAPTIGLVLCNTAEEENQLIADWKGEQLAVARQTEVKAEDDAKEAKSEAQLVLKSKGK